MPNKRLGLEFDPSHFVRQFIDPIPVAWHFKDRILAVHAKDTEIIQPVLQQVGIAGKGWWRYRIPGQGIVNWPEFLTVLLQIGYFLGVLYRVWKERRERDARSDCDKVAMPVAEDAKVGGLPAPSLNRSEPFNP